MTRTREDIQQLKTQAGLKPYQSRLKDLDSKGAEYWASCPWHERNGKHNPSLAVYKSKEDGTWLFKCMAGASCEKRKGDAITFVQQMDSLTFAEAVRQIANEAGVTESVESAPSMGTPSAEQFATARLYLAEHGVDAETAKACGVNAVLHPKLGLALTMPYDSDPQVIKYRCVGEPKNKSSKFLHASGHPSDALLYNIKHTEKELDHSFISEVYVVESERDCLMMNSLGHMAVSVSSATACIDSEGKLKIDDDSLAILARADEIFLTLDQDPAGQKCADAFETDPAFTSNQLKRIQWPYGGKRSKDPKDIGDLYKADPEEFLNKMQGFVNEARIRPPKWRQAFRTLAELDDRDVIQLIEGFLPEGNIGFGGLSGAGKTFVALSITKALTTGRPFVGKFNVPEIVPVLYLSPEVGDRQFRKRAKAFGIPWDDDSKFLCRTLSQGATLPLDNPFVLEAVRQLHKPVVILDTAIRFSSAADENSSVQNAWMEKAIRSLREAGCVAVVALHHSPKRLEEGPPTLENTFRGTGDIGALLDVGYSIRTDRKLKDSSEGEQVTIQCVKARDMEDAPPRFNLGLKYRIDGESKLQSFIDETGDLVLMAAPASDLVKIDRRDQTRENVNKKRMADEDAKFLTLVRLDPTASLRTLQAKMNLGRKAVKRVSERLGYEWEDEKWTPAPEMKSPKSRSDDFDALNAVEEDEYTF
jgi:hypothetical protein